MNTGTHVILGFVCLARAPGLHASTLWRGAAGRIPRRTSGEFGKGRSSFLRQPRASSGPATRARLDRRLRAEAFERIRRSRHPAPARLRRATPPSFWTRAGSRSRKSKSAGSGRFAPSRSCRCRFSSPRPTRFWGPSSPSSCTPTAMQVRIWYRTSASGECPPVARPAQHRRQEETVSVHPVAGHPRPKLDSAARLARARG